MMTVRTLRLGCFLIGHDCKMQSSFLFLMIRPRKMQGSIGGDVISNTSSDYAGAIKKMKAHKKIAGTEFGKIRQVGASPAFLC